MVVGGEHQAPAEEEEFAGRLGEDVRGGGTVVKGDHFRGRGEGTRPGRWGTSALAPCHGIRGIAQFGCSVPRSWVSSFPVATYVHTPVVTYVYLRRLSSDFPSAIPEKETICCGPRTDRFRTYLG